jgi:hypothetical protein
VRERVLGGLAEPRMRQASTLITSISPERAIAVTRGCRDVPARRGRAVWPRVVTRSIDSRSSRSAPGEYVIADRRKRQ